MTILNASNSSISLDYQAWLQVPSNIVDDEALQTLIHSPTQFAEIFGGGWRVDYFGTFNNYGFFDGNKVLYPESATVTSITATNNGNAFIDWTELSWNPMLNYKSGQELNADILAGNDTISAVGFQTNLPDLLAMTQLMAAVAQIRPNLLCKKPTIKLPRLLPASQ